MKTGLADASITSYVPWVKLITDSTEFAELTRQGVNLEVVPILVTWHLFGWVGWSSMVRTTRIWPWKAGSTTWQSLPRGNIVYCFLLESSGFGVNVRAVRDPEDMNLMSTLGFSQYVRMVSWFGAVQRVPVLWDDLCALATLKVYFVLGNGVDRCGRVRSSARRCFSAFLLFFWVFAIFRFFDVFG